MSRAKMFFCSAYNLDQSTRMYVKETYPVAVKTYSAGATAMLIPEERNFRYDSVSVPEGPVCLPACLSFTHKNISAQ
jgi:hypothetical protein